MTSTLEPHPLYPHPLRPSVGRIPFAGTRVWSRVAPYLQILRVDHWFKNVFMVLGVVAAVFYRPDLAALSSLPVLAVAVLATCIVASSNYVLNEYLDGPLDRLHPTKRARPAARGLVRGAIAIPEWLLTAALGLTLAFAINPAFGFSAVALWVMGCAYNIRPVRSKDVPYVDVLSESINNPIRLLLGWFCLIPDQIPPISLALAYWMVGAFFMATKRFAEYRSIGDGELAARYRKSFRHYNDVRLLISMMFYVTAGALFSGIFIVLYKPELILAVPVVAGFFAYYLKLGLKPDSPVQTPEKLHTERSFLAYAVVTAGVFVALMFVEIPKLQVLFGLYGGGGAWGAGH